MKRLTAFDLDLLCETNANIWCVMLAGVCISNATRLSLPMETSDVRHGSNKTQHISLVPHDVWIWKRPLWVSRIKLAKETKTQLKKSIKSNLYQSPNEILACLFKYSHPVIFNVSAIPVLYAICIVREPIKFQRECKYLFKYKCLKRILFWDYICLS